MTRVFYPDCRVEVAAWGEREAWVCEDAEVWIEGDAILISYFDEDGIVVLEGRADPPAGWQLAARSRPRRATLTAIENDPRSYTGRIEEQGESGSWALRLGKPTDG
jgi:hypothetical protein